MKMEHGITLPIFTNLFLTPHLSRLPDSPSINSDAKMLDSVEAIGCRHQPRDAVGHLRDIAQQGADEALQDHDAMRRDTACADRWANWEV